jgi:hypothetical protein
MADDDLPGKPLPIKRVEGATRSWRDLLKTHPAAELFPLMSRDELRELGEDILANGLQVPLVVFRAAGDQWRLLDGRNRLDAMESVGFSFVRDPKQEIFPMIRRPDGARFDGSDEFVGWNRLIDDDIDPYDFVVSANIRRRHLTSEQKGELIAALLKAAPERSDRATAKIAHVDHKTVATKRRELEGSGEIPHSVERIGADGRTTRPVRRPAERKLRDEVDPRTPPQIRVVRVKLNPTQLRITRTRVEFKPDPRLERIDRELQAARGSEAEDGVAEGAAEPDPSPAQPSDRFAPAVAAVAELDPDDMSEFLTRLDKPHFAAIRDFFDTKLSG